MGSQINDEEIEEVIPYDYAEGKEYDYSGCRFRSSRRGDDYVKLDISSWVGISAGAMHSYGHLYLPFLSAQCLSKPKTEKLWKVGEWSGGSCTEPVEKYRKIVLTRPVSRKDVKRDPERYRSYSIGMPTNGFDTEKELLAKAKKEFKRIFAPGWILYIEKMRQINKPHEREFWETYKEILVKADER